MATSQNNKCGTTAEQQLQVGVARAHPFPLEELQLLGLLIVVAALQRVNTFLSARVAIGVAKVGRVTAAPRASHDAPERVLLTQLFQTLQLWSLWTVNSTPGPITTGETKKWPQEFV